MRQAGEEAFEASRHAAHPPPGARGADGSPPPLESPPISVPGRPLSAWLPVNQTLHPSEGGGGAVRRARAPCPSRCPEPGPLLGPA